MNIHSCLSLFLFFNTILLVVFPENSMIYYAALVLMTLVGSLGHVLFRCYVWDRPAIQSTIGSSILVLISYSVQLLSLKKTATESFDILAPNWTASKIEEYPKVTCFIYSFPMFGLGTLTKIGFLLPMAAVFRKKFSGDYLAANHFKLKRCLYIGLVTLITIPYIAQVTVCRGLCNWKLFKGNLQNTFKHNSSLQSKNLEDCWIPFLPFLTFLCLILYGAWAVIKGIEILKSVFKSDNSLHRNIKRQTIKSLSEESNTMDLEMQERKKDESVEENWKNSSQSEEEIKQENNYEYLTKMSSKYNKQQMHKLGLKIKNTSKVSIAQDKKVEEDTRLNAKKEERKQKCYNREVFDSYRFREMSDKQEGEAGTSTESKIQTACQGEKKRTKIQVQNIETENLETEDLEKSRKMNEVVRTVPDNESGPNTQNMNPCVMDSEQSPPHKCEGLQMYIFIFFFVMMQIMLVFVFLLEDNASVIGIVFRLTHVMLCFSPWVLILNKDNIMVWFRRMISDLFVKMGFPQNLEL